MNWEDSVRWLRSQPDKLDLVVASYYDDPLIEAAKRYCGSDEWNAILEFLPAPSGMRALDVGAGRGIASFALAERGFHVTALEPDDSARVGAQAIRSLASEANLPINVIPGVSERLPFQNGEFDLVFGRAVLHHIRDLPCACRELFRVLKPGGTFLAVREHVISRARDLGLFFQNHPLQRLYGGENANLLNYYLDSLRNAGFILDRVIEPLRSPINLAPHSEKSFQAELAKRASFGSHRFAGALRAAFAVPGSWSLARFLLERVDNRAGRLYSFVAHRP